MVFIFLAYFTLYNGEGGGRGDRDGEDMWTQGLFISMYDRIHYKLKKKKMKFDCIWIVKSPLLMKGQLVGLNQENNLDGDKGQLVT